MIQSSRFLCLPSMRSCFRCGKEFRADEKERICPECRRPADKKAGTGERLSFREQQIVALVQEAKLNKEIAYDLHLAEGTIKEYLNRIFRKLGVSNRTELAIWAIRQKDAA